MQFRTKRKKEKDGEIGKGKQLESANAPLELGCFLYFFLFFPSRKVYMINKILCCWLPLRLSVFLALVIQQL